MQESEGEMTNKKAVIAVALLTASGWLGFFVGLNYHSPVSVIDWGLVIINTCLLIAAWNIFKEPQ